MEQSVESFRERLRNLVRKMGLLEEAEANCCGVTLGQCHAIGEIGRSESLNLNTLADRLSLDKSTMSRTLNSLVEAGYAIREASPEDRRYVEIHLSDQGQQQFKTIETYSQTHYQHVLNEIPNDKMEQVLESLKLLAEAFQRADALKDCSCSE